VKKPRAWLGTEAEEGRGACTLGFVVGVAMIKESSLSLWLSISMVGMSIGWGLVARQAISATAAGGSGGALIGIYRSYRPGQDNDKGFPVHEPRALILSISLYSLQSNNAIIGILHVQPVMPVAS
jgi:hypothetical protein